jgi:hypothetical protein
MICEVCNGQPAAQILLQSASSRIIWWNHVKVDAILCGNCAEVTYYHQQRRTLIQGWWGIVSSLATILFSFLNFVRITQHRSLVRTVDVYGVAAKRPKFKITRNPAAMIASAIAIFIILSILVPTLITPSPYTTGALHALIG